MLEHFQAVHMVGVIPPYHNPHIFQPVRVFVVVRNKGKQSEPYAFSYMPSIALDTGKSAVLTATLAVLDLPDKMASPQIIVVLSFRKNSLKGIIINRFYKVFS
jgi:hypothetical protein